MKKLDIIKDILDSAKIHHNIRIDWSRSRKAIEKANLTDEQAEKFNTDMQIEGYMVEQFKEDWENWRDNPIKAFRNTSNLHNYSPKNP